MIRGERGVALAMVVWFIAGMSLMVAGIVANARMDSKTTQVHLARAKAVAAGDGAIRLAMVQRRLGYSSSGQGPQVSETAHRLGDVEVTVRLYPASGFINISSAPKEVLAVLFHVAGGMERGEAQFVADNVVKWRQGRVSKNQIGRRPARPQKFHSLEDVLRVEGVSRSLLDGIRDYAVAGSWVSSSTNWNASPESMLAVLKGVDPAKARQSENRRSASSAANANRATRGGNAGGVFRADALVQYGGRTWLRRRWLNSDKPGDYGLPWRVVRTEAPRVVQG